MARLAVPRVRHPSGTNSLAGRTQPLDLGEALDQLVVGFGVEDLGIERRHGLFDGRCCLPGLGLQREEAHPPVVSDSIQDLAEVEAVFDAHELVAEAS